jgi:hypothetical protein
MPFVSFVPVVRIVVGVIVSIVPGDPILAAVQHTVDGSESSRRRRSCQARNRSASVDHGRTGDAGNLWEIYHLRRKRRKKLAQEKPWRPADYPPLAVYMAQPATYVPPQMRANWGFQTVLDGSSAPRSGAQRRQRQRSRRGRLTSARIIVAWACACGLFAGIVALVVAVLVLHVR